MLGERRSEFDHLKLLVAKPLARTGMPPWVITLMGLPLGLTAAALLWRGHTFAALAVGIAASLTDFFDGTVARLQNRSSALGNYLEAIVDKIVELTLLLGLAVFEPWPASFAIAASMFIAYCKPRVALVVQTDNRDWPGLADHPDRMVLILIGFACHAIPGKLFGFSATGWCLWLLAALACLGAAQRLCFAARLIREAEQEGRLLEYVSGKRL